LNDGIIKGEKITADLVKSIENEFTRIVGELAAEEKQVNKKRKDPDSKNTCGFVFNTDSITLANRFLLFVSNEFVK